MAPSPENRNQEGLDLLARAGQKNLRSSIKSIRPLIESAIFRTAHSVNSRLVAVLGKSTRQPRHHRVRGLDN